MGYISDCQAEKQGLANQHVDSRDTRFQDRTNWTDLWDAMSSAIRGNYNDKRWEIPYKQHYWHLSALPILSPDELLAECRSFAGKCLRIMESIEDSSEGDRLEQHSAYLVLPDELATALGLFICREDALKYPRLARLQGKGRPDFGKLSSLRIFNPTIKTLPVDGPQPMELWQVAQIDDAANDTA